MSLWRSIVFVFLAQSVMGQELTGTELLDKAINFHDPNSKWTSFEGTLNIKMETPNASDRISTIQMNLPKEIFHLKVSKDENTYSFTIDGNECSTSLNGTTEISEGDMEKFRLTCERGRMYRDYYTYLYGLPMKLRDPGTIVDDKMTKATFKGKDYLKLKVTYEMEVGEDTWYFYFDPNTYAMEVYQFFHQEAKNDGEYILLTGMEEINGIKMPKRREWYYNKDNKFLGVDILD